MTAYRPVDQSGFSVSQLAIQSISDVSYTSFCFSRIWIVAEILFRFQQCALAMGFSLIDDANLPDALCDGVSNLDSTVDQNKQRVSTLEAYLPRATALKREGNLTICTGVLVSRIEFSGDEAEHRAEQVSFQYANSTSEKVFSVRVNKEVVISSGAVGSPQILMLRSENLSHQPIGNLSTDESRNANIRFRSGIGPRQHLEEHGIEVVRDLPGVGSELVRLLLQSIICHYRNMNPNVSV